MPDRLIQRLNGARGSALLSIGFAGIWHGFAYLPIAGPSDEVPSGLQAIGSLVPLPFYAGLWIGVGAASGIAAFTDRHGYPRLWDQWAFYAFTGLSALWAFAYYIGFAASVEVYVDLPALQRPGSPADALRTLRDLFTAVEVTGNRQWISGGVYLGIAGLTVSAMRMRNRFVIDLRDIVIDTRPAS